MGTTIDNLTANALATQLVQTYGHLMGGHDLVRISGCSSRRDLTMKAKAGRVGFRVFQIEGRTGAFALTQDIANWLWELRSTAAVASDVSSLGRRGMAGTPSQSIRKEWESDVVSEATPRTSR